VGHVRDIAVDDLSHGDMTAICGDVEGLRLDTGVGKSSPFQVVPRQLGVRHGLGLLSDGVNGRGAIDGFLGSGDVGEPLWICTV